LHSAFFAINVGSQQPKKIVLKENKIKDLMKQNDLMQRSVAIA